MLSEQRSLHVIYWQKNDITCGAVLCCGTSSWQEARRNLSLPSEEAKFHSFCSASAPPKKFPWPPDPVQFDWVNPTLSFQSCCIFSKLELQRCAKTRNFTAEKWNSLQNQSENWTKISAFWLKCTSCLSTCKHSLRVCVHAFMKTALGGNIGFKKCASKSNKYALRPTRCALFWPNGCKDKLDGACLIFWVKMNYAAVTLLSRGRMLWMWGE